jgi:hypothetical protein
MRGQYGIQVRRAKDDVRPLVGRGGPSAGTHSSKHCCGIFNFSDGGYRAISVSPGFFSLSISAFVFDGNSISPGMSIVYFLQKWINAAHREFVDKLIRRMSGKVQVFRNAELRDQVESVLARNALPVFNDYIKFIHDLIGFSLNSVLSLLAMGFLLPSRLWWGYALSFLFCFMIIVGLKKIIHRYPRSMKLVTSHIPAC